MPPADQLAAAPSVMPPGAFSAGRGAPPRAHPAPPPAVSTGRFCLAAIRAVWQSAAGLFRLDGNEVRTAILMCASLLGAGVLLPLRIRGCEPNFAFGACIGAMLYAGAAGFAFAGGRFPKGSAMRFASKIHAAALSAWLAGEAAAAALSIPWPV